MKDFERELLNRPPEWHLVLQAYQERHRETQEADPEYDGWLPRVTSPGGVCAERLSRIHGVLIAFGYLKFRLGGRAAGLLYQITSEGKQALHSFAEEEGLSDRKSNAA